MKRWIFLALAAIAALSALAFVACKEKEGPTATPTPTPTEEEGAVVHVDLKEFSVTPDVDEVEVPGSITFRAENHGTIPHNLYIFKTDLPSNQLPVEGGRVPEEGVAGLEFVGETEDFSPREEESVTVDLTPGRYVLICNVVGHYQAGMYTEVTVG